MYDTFITIPHDKEIDVMETLKQAQKECPNMGQIWITNANGVSMGCSTDKDEKIRLAGKLPIGVQIKSVERVKESIEIVK